MLVPLNSKPKFRAPWLSDPSHHEDIEEKYYADKEDAYDMRKTPLA